MVILRQKMRSDCRTAGLGLALGPAQGATLLATAPDAVWWAKLFEVGRVAGERRGRAPPPRRPGPPRSRRPRRAELSPVSG